MLHINTKSQTLHQRRKLLDIIAALLNISISVSCVAIGLKEAKNGSLYGFHDRHDQFMDFFNPVIDSRSPSHYTKKLGVYPPALNTLLNHIGPCHGETRQFICRDTNRFRIIGSIAVFLLANTFAIARILKYTSVSWLQAFTAAAILSLAPPMIFAIDRLNLILLPYA